MARRPLEREQVYLDGGRRTTQLMRDSLGGTTHSRGNVGAWGAGSFENDDALDWLSEFRAEGLQAAGAAVADVLALQGQFLEAPIAARAVAAAEVIAAASGRPGSDLPTDLTDWLKAHGAFQSPELRKNASDALDHVMAQSELRDLWAESDEFSAWEATLRDIRSRLR